MKKKYTILTNILFASFAFGQVGINTDNPRSTLDVVASPTDNTKTDGVIAPRLRGTELKDKDSLYTTDQTGTIVYITEPLSLDETTDKTQFVTSTGYYFFDGNIWHRFSSSDRPAFVTDKKYTDSNVRWTTGSGSTPGVIYENLSLPRPAHFIKNDLELGLEASITVPPNEIMNIVVNYSFPVGTDDILGNEWSQQVAAKGYLGGRFMRSTDGGITYTEAPEASRKYSIPSVDFSGLSNATGNQVATIPHAVGSNGDISSWRMVSITSQLIETVDNSTGTEPIVLNYKILGYVELLNRNEHNSFRFNQFSNETPSAINNYNWGRGSITAVGYFIK